MKQKDYLWKLQEIEKNLEQKERILKDVIKGEEISKRIAEHKCIKNDFETQKDILKAKENILRKLEHERRELEYEIEEIKERLYSGKINDLKQLEKLMKKEENKKEELNEIDSKTLEIMEVVDDLKEEIKKIGVKGGTLGSTIKNMLKERKIKIEKIEKDIIKIKAEKEALLKKINEEYIRMYMDIKSKKNNPVAILKEDVCMGCHMDLPVMTVTKLKKQDIVLCNNCGRILYPKSDE
ncbi:zinc ribbon domain-containing protein [Crassaminicella indica]|uniref:C4-type zinc ribbon domain-containing protein n=1 Tax=Crassaminicella indica TaxID=2855394 RepID=A0ABX8R9I0_9CLOT|nr:C4-type zinc ribbon domain-containing protein [Crassaminicella indica]QXM05719.1 hypothetical protein KVH43_10130 [Crassaminicella indica]